MSLRVLLPTALRYLAGNQDEVELSGRNIGELMRELVVKFPDLRKHLYNEEGRIRNFVNIYINDEDVRYLQEEQTPVKDGDVVSIVPSIAGGNLTAIQETLAKVELNNDEIKRYSRHLIMPEVAMEGQKKLKSAKILLVGTGGLGAPLGLYLAAAGIGRLGLVDFDVVDFSNLQRQVIHSTKDVGRPKLDSAKEKILGINPHVQVDTYETMLKADNALDIIRGYDIVIDGTDNFPTRYLVNDACVLLDKPNVYGSIFRFEGQASVFYAREGPCYRCLYPEPPPPGLVPSCAEGGVLGILPGTIGLIQATEAVKLILGKGSSLIGRLLLYDALEMKFRELKLRKNPNCPLCGENPTIKALIDYDQFCGITPQPVAAAPVEESFEITPEQLKARLDRGDRLTIVDVREPHEYDICRLPNSVLIPLGQIASRMHELNSADEIIVHCKMGGRSAKAVKQLREAGFKKIKNLTGGIDLWAQKVDPSVPRY
jgi:molybdopterin/thiamine biosynthesis adenylyltransferase/rhodanese-related sulfurtransferase/molybdopterin converting factor small subunit